MATWSRISHAAATGSAKVARSVGMVSGRMCRFLSGRVKYSLKAPGWPAMPSTGRCGQCRPRPARHQSQAPQARLISPTTRRPMSAGWPASTMRPAPWSQYNQEFMPAELTCFSPACRARFAITDVLYNCPRCGGLIEAGYPDWSYEPAALKKLWRERRMSNLPLDASGVWRYREMIPFLGESDRVVSLREGNTPLLDAPRAAAYAGLDRLTFKHQGFNPTGSFKDNGMTCGTAQALRLGMKRVACVSTGNTSASMAAYASAAGLDPIIFIPHGNISYGKLAQALDYGARTLQVEANFDQILALVRTLADRIGIYLLNSINPFRIEGQKTNVVEMMDQRDWRVPYWIVLPGGALGNTSAFGKALREMRALGLIDRSPRLAVIQAEGSAPFYDLARAAEGASLQAVENPQPMGTAIRRAE